MQPKIFISKVFHKRLFPRINDFSYNMYYLALPLSGKHKLSELKNLKYNKNGLLSFYEKDHGDKTDSGLLAWVKGILETYECKAANGEIVLVCLPRVLGYVFNPVSFYFCFDSSGGLRAVISEVNNTFGETHVYICHNHNELIDEDLWMKAEKIFHVSPFLERNGHYNFRFAFKNNNLGVWIDYYNASGEKQLITSMIGSFQELNDKNLRRVFWKYPLITFMTIFLIHYQALKLVSKRIKYFVKPQQNKVRITSNIT